MLATFMLAKLSMHKNQFAYRVGLLKKCASGRGIDANVCLLTPPKKLS